jgi:hypothetical protein
MDSKEQFCGSASGSVGSVWFWASRICIRTVSHKFGSGSGPFHHHAKICLIFNNKAVEHFNTISKHIVKRIKLVPKGERYLYFCPLLRIRIRDPVPFRPLDPESGMGKKSGSGSGMNNPDHISESLETIFGLKYLNS